MTFPLTLDLLRRREVLLKSFSDRGPENARRAQDDLFGDQNSRKARLGGLAGLQDPAVMEAKRQAETKLRQTVSQRSQADKMRATLGTKLPQALDVWRSINTDHELLRATARRSTATCSTSPAMLRAVGRGDGQAQRRSAARVSRAELDSLKQQLFSERRSIDDLEIVKLADSLGMLHRTGRSRRSAGREADLAGKSPSERAARVGSGHEAGRRGAPQATGRRGRGGHRQLRTTR